MHVKYSAKSGKEVEIEKHTLRTRTLLVARKIYTKPSTFVKYAIKLVGTANPVTNSKFVEQYVTNNKANQIF
jgi:hypothetical protein